MQRIKTNKLNGLIDNNLITLNPKYWAGVVMYIEWQTIGWTKNYMNGTRYLQD
jgi:hypothetical protein